MPLEIKPKQFIETNFASLKNPSLNPNIEDGRFHGKCSEPANDIASRYNKAECETVYHGENNTFIVFGRDRASGWDDGTYGSKPHNNCGAIDIVVGRISAFVKDIREIDGKINPSFSADASRIYIAQKTDVDRNFKICHGRGGRSGAKAAIAIKSDDIRIIARNSLKLVTATETLTSTDDNISNITGIQLIAGNDDSDLQPIPKGNNLRIALEQIVDDIHKLAGIVTAFYDIQSNINSALFKHTHITTFFGNETILPHGETFKQSIAAPLQGYHKVDGGMRSFNLVLLKSKIENIQNINSSYHFLN